MFTLSCYDLKYKILNTYFKYILTYECIILLKLCIIKIFNLQKKKVKREVHLITWTHLSVN